MKLLITAATAAMALSAAQAGAATYPAHVRHHVVSTAPPTIDKGGIQALESRFGAAASNGDAAAVGSMYTLDATILPPGAKRLDGRPAIQAYWGGAIQQVTDVHLSTLDVRTLGAGSVQELGTYSMRAKGPAPQTLTGKYVVIWRKVGADWQLATDAWSADQ
jgi:uncharacterized protein (TIGR02246 family)